MFKRILVCLDGSKLAEQIIPYIIEEASAVKSKVILLQVLSVPGIVTPDIPGFPGVTMRTSPMLDRLRKDEDKAKDYLEHVAQRFREQGVHAECVTLEGPPGPTITSYTNENNIDLIAIATHGYSGLRHILFGSVAEFVVRESTVPILMIRPKHPEV